VIFFCTWQFPLQAEPGQKGCGVDEPLRRVVSIVAQSQSFVM
jgi:hypothetical protein